MTDDDARRVQVLLDRARAEGRQEAAAALRREADRYQKEDGSPGDLATTWGWKVIASHLRFVARELEK